MLLKELIGSFAIPTYSQYERYQLFTYLSSSIVFKVDRLDGTVTRYRKVTHHGGLAGPELAGYHANLRMRKLGIEIETKKQQVDAVAYSHFHGRESKISYVAIAKTC